ncbi:hypothetical protein GCM10007862_35570 [Dyella lipolytica]|uniref:Outer membrane lipoprotein BamD-like domain-containing protein n=1 Tax=Dyella lipolytica TaxID=1867835 RepID=A0ABW8IPW4_9GAMM|nr:hypothetical protein [Dyella lipolytica]GLQ48506.1 hypothetical protein GCM10007862_35570 [Dyella lipolytica]
MAKMLKYVFTFVLGCVFSGIVILFASMRCSQVWQSELRAKVLYDLQKAGFDAAHNSNWTKAIDNLESANQVGSTAIGEWKLSFPIYGWSVYHLAPKEETAFRLTHDCVIAYSLEREGSKAEADAAFSKLQSQYPNRDRQYFEAVAKGVVGSQGT